MNPYEAVQATVLPDQPPPKRSKLSEFFENCWRLFVILLVVIFLLVFLTILPFIDES